MPQSHEITAAILEGSANGSTVPPWRNLGSVHHWRSECTQPMAAILVSHLKSYWLLRGLAAILLGQQPSCSPPPSQWRPFSYLHNQRWPSCPSSTQPMAAILLPINYNQWQPSFPLPTQPMATILLSISPANSGHLAFHLPNQQSPSYFSSTQSMAAILLSIYPTNVHHLALHLPNQWQPSCTPTTQPSVPFCSPSNQPMVPLHSLPTQTMAAILLSINSSNGGCPVFHLHNHSSHLAPYLLQPVAAIFSYTTYGSHLALHLPNQWQPSCTPSAQPAVAILFSIHPTISAILLTANPSNGGHLALHLLKQWWLSCPPSTQPWQPSCSLSTTTRGSHLFLHNQWQPSCSPSPQPMAAILHSDHPTSGGHFVLHSPNHRCHFTHCQPIQWQPSCSPLTQATVAILSSFYTTMSAICGSHLFLHNQWQPSCSPSTQAMVAILSSICPTNGSHLALQPPNQWWPFCSPFIQPLVPLHSLPTQTMAAILLSINSSNSGYPVLHLPNQWQPSCTPSAQPAVAILFSIHPTIGATLLTANPNDSGHLGHAIRHPSYLQMPPQKTHLKPTPKAAFPKQKIKIKIKPKQKKKKTKQIQAKTSRDLGGGRRGRGAKRGPSRTIASRYHIKISMYIYYSGIRSLWLGTGRVRNGGGEEMGEGWLGFGGGSQSRLMRRRKATRPANLSRSSSARSPAALRRHSTWCSMLAEALENCTATTGCV